MSDSKAKKSGGFFKKPSWLVEKAKEEAKVEETKDATEMFARSTGTVSDVLAEQKRKEQQRAEKQARAAQKEVELRKAKRRKLSDDEEYGEPNSDEKKDSISPRSTQQHAHTSPHTLSERYDAVLTSERTKKKAQDNVIELSDGESSSDGTPTPARRTDSTVRLATAVIEAAERDDEEEDFPELAAAARARLKQEVNRWTSLNGPSKSLAEHSPDTRRAIDTASNPIIDLLVYSSIEGTTPLLVKRRWNQNFRDVRKAWLQRQTNIPESVKNDVYFTWRDKKVFDVASCKSIGIRLDQYGNAQIPGNQGAYKDSDDRVVLCATTDAQLNAEKEARERAEMEQEREEEEAAAPPEQSQPSNQIRVILKAKGYNDQKLIVKPETTIERLAGAFKRYHKLPEDTSVVLKFDGEDLESDMTVEDAEIEDMNMIEVYVR